MSRGDKESKGHLRIVCAWCQATIRFTCCPVADPDQVSHSICSDCLKPLLGDLDADDTLPPLPA